MKTAKSELISLDKLALEVEAWQAEVFPDSHLEGVLAHLEEEVAELTLNPKEGHELADIFILLVSVANHVGISLADAVAAKMVLNRQRTWGEPDERGVINHVRENE